MAECRDCKYYERIPKRRAGYCRNPKSYHYALKRQGSDKAADYCFLKLKEGGQCQDT